MRTHLTMVIDRSLSMQSVAPDATEAINKFIEDQKAVPGKCRFTFIEFDDRAIDTLHRNIKLSEVETASYVLRPRGNTPLLDAVGAAITNADADIAARTEAGKKPFDKVIFVIATDGLENASCIYTLEQIQGLITNRQDVLGWHFVFLGAGVDAFAQERMAVMASAMGTHSKSTMTHDASPEGYGVAVAAASAAVMDSRLTGAEPEFTEEDREQARS